MKSSILIIASIVGISACYPKYNDVVIDNKYTKWELKIIDDTIKEWYMATGSESASLYTQVGHIGDGIFDIDDYTHDFGYATIQKVSRLDPGFQELADEFGNIPAGVGRDGQIVITVTEEFYRPDFNVTRFHTVMLHELGHFFGLDHNEGGIMTRGTKLVCIDQETVDYFCDDHGDCLFPYGTCDNEEAKQILEDEKNFCEENDCED